MRGIRSSRTIGYALFLVLCLTASSYGSESASETTELISSEQKTHASEWQNADNLRRILSLTVISLQLTSKTLLNLWTKNQIVETFDLHPIDPFLTPMSILATLYIQTGTNVTSILNMASPPDALKQPSSEYGSIADSETLSNIEDDAVSLSSQFMNQNSYGLKKNLQRLCVLFGNTSFWNAFLSAQTLLGKTADISQALALAFVLYIPDMVTAITFDAENFEQAFHELAHNLQNAGPEAIPTIVAMIAAMTTGCLYFFSNNEGMRAFAAAMEWNPRVREYSIFLVGLTTLVHFFLDTPTKMHNLMRASKRLKSRIKLPQRNHQFYPIHLTIVNGAYIPFILASQICAFAT